jgi:hypothetical protein
LCLGHGLGRPSAVGRAAQRGFWIRRNLRPALEALSDPPQSRGGASELVGRLDVRGALRESSTPDPTNADREGSGPAPPRRGQVLLRQWHRWSRLGRGAVGIPRASPEHTVPPGTLPERSSAPLRAAGACFDGREVEGVRAGALGARDAINLEDLLTGKYPPVGTCPHCGHASSS